ncbi:MAG: hypothetical protein LBC33_02275 [Mycoplasmataceae bacterium]|jgi:hypothetical protein|nr:hypothetical protein [Mycoplasmataceae bacterium]
MADYQFKQQKNDKDNNSRLERINISPTQKVNLNDDDFEVDAPKKSKK